MIQQQMLCFDIANGASSSMEDANDVQNTYKNEVNNC